ncbi:MAG: hypothetical protein H6Q73_2352 [Firmicutes bacterium]|nr:hypothetical protein [Bacillota bacterium]
MGVDVGVAAYLCGIMIVLALVCAIGQMHQKAKQR